MPKHFLSDEMNHHMNDCKDNYVFCMQENLDTVKATVVKAPSVRVGELGSYNLV